MQLGLIQSTHKHKSHGAEVVNTQINNQRHFFAILFHSILQTYDKYVCQADEQKRQQRLYASFRQTGRDQ